MSVNVMYEGVALAEGVDVRPGELGLFLPLAAPMPVGTRLVLERANVGRQPVRVNKVQEGAESGVYIAAEGALVFPLIEESAVAAVPAPPAKEPEAPARKIEEPALPEKKIEEPPAQKPEPKIEEPPAKKGDEPAPGPVVAQAEAAVVEMDSDEPEIKIAAEPTAAAPEEDSASLASSPDAGGDKPDGDKNGRGRRRSTTGKRGGGKR